MEKFMQREENDVFIGYENSSKAQSSDDMNFNDVFGGPPRRFSMQEVRVRYSFGETSEGPEEEKTLSSMWSSITEKPVFGEETGPRRHHQGGDFFGDIFRGTSETYYNSPRSDDNVFGSSPGLRARSLSKLESFGTSLPTQFSLPAKLTKAIELPVFGSNNQGTHNTGTTNDALKNPHSSTSPLSRFSNQAIKGQDKTRKEIRRQSSLSRQPSSSSRESPITATSDTKDDTNNLEKEYSKNEDSFDNQFHFSIYKWAGPGVPMLLSLVAESNMKSKVNKNNHENKTSSVVKQVLSDTLAESLKIERENKAVYEIPEPISRRNADDINVVREKEVHLKKGKLLENDVKPTRALFTDEDEQPENTPETKARHTKGVDANAHDDKNAKKNGRKNNSVSANVEKSVLQDDAVSSGVISRKSVAKGKVKEFVHIFSHEVDSRPKPEFRKRSQISRLKNLAVDQNDNEVSSNAVAKDKEKEKVNLQNEDKKSDVSVKVDENLNYDEPQQQSSNHVSTNLKNSFSSETIHRDSKISVENFDDPLEFVVQVLSDDHPEKATQDENFEAMKAIDAKIRQWSVGKKGNIRSLLSTLQYVLWTGSGWKPVPLVDLIEANAVKRAYQKALLRLHPDKLQQKGADFHHKYIAQKVFDILQEAWDHFNTYSSLNL